MKIKQLLGAALMVLIAAPFTSCNKGGEIFDNIDLVPVKVSKEKWSFLDSEGNLLFEDEFKECPTIVYNGCFSMENKDKYTLYKVNGDKYDVLGDLENLYAVGYVEEGLVPVTFPKQRISVYTDGGKKKFEIDPVDGQEVVAVESSFSDGMLAFALEDGKIGFLNTKGEVAIKANFDDATRFNDGLAVVAKKSQDDDKVSYLVINKKGETVFKLKDDQEPRTVGNNAFNNGYMVVKDSDRDILYNTKGEVTKFPSKINRIYATNGKAVIYANEDYDMGVVDMEGETIIRPNYSDLEFDGDGFVGKKDKEVYLIDSKGEVKEKLDYENIEAFGKFGYFVYNGSRYSLINAEGKEKCKEDFYDLQLHKLSPGKKVRSDYFDVTTVAKTLVDMIGTNGVGDLTFGTPSSKVFADKSPNSYTYNWSGAVESLKKEGFRYSIEATGFFTEYIALSQYNYGSGYNYYWNPESKLYGFIITLSSPSEIGKDGYNAVVADVTKAGFKEEKSGYNGADMVALFSKGNESVYVVGNETGNALSVTVFDKNTEQGSRAYQEFTSGITKEKNGYPEEVEMEPDAYYDEFQPDDWTPADSAWVDTVRYR